MANKPHLTGTEMSFDEIAEELGIRPGTARAIFQSGMKKLRCRAEMFRQYRNARANGGL
jgi:predicted transcriptional regulator